MAQSTGTGEVISIIPENPVIKQTEINNTALASTEYKKVDFVNVTTGAERQEKFNISTESENFFADEVYNFYETFADLKDVPTTPRDMWVHDFVKTFQKSYPNLKPEEVRDKTLEFVRTPQGLTFAVKISEWELTAEQGGSGAFIEVSPRSSQYRDQMYVIAGNNSEGSVLNPDRNILQKVVSNFTPVAPEGKGGKWRHTPEEREFYERTNPLYHAYREKSLRERDTSHQIKVVFWDKQGNLTRDSKVPIEYDLTKLTNLQKEFLIRKGRLHKDNTGTIRPIRFSDDASVGGEAGDFAATRIKNELRERFQAITKARIDFYEKTGRDPNSIPINTVDRNGNYVDRRDRQYLKVEKEADQNMVPDIRIELDNQMNYLMADIKKSLADRLKEEKQKAKEAAEKGIVTDTLTAVDAQIQSLDENTMSEEDKKKEEEKLEKEIIETKSRKESLQKLEQLDKDRKQTQNDLDAVELELDLPTIPNLERAESDLRDTNQYIDELNRLIPAIQKEMSDIGSALANRSLSPASQTTLIGERTALSGRLTTALSDLSIYNGLKISYEEEVAKYEQDLNPSYSREQNRENFKKRKELASKKSRQDYQHGAIEARLKVDAKNVDASTGNLYPAKHFESEETRLNSQKEKVGFPDSERSHKKEVITMFKDEVVNKYDEIMTRAKTWEDKKDPGHDELVRKMEQQAVYYQDHPLVYTQTLRLIFGPDIAYPGRENAEKFQRAANLITPEIFLAELKKAYPRDPMVMSIMDVHDPLLKHPDLTKKTKGRFIASLVRRVSTEATAGTLSDMNPIVKSQIDSLKTVVPSSISLNETELNTIRGESYYYRNAEDLTNQILDRWVRVPTSAAYWTPATVKEDARAYAEEIIKRKQKEVRS